MTKFECLECGHCCRRILVVQEGLQLGMFLLPDERSLFAEFPDAVLPYIGIRRPDESRVKTVWYQMVCEPCPLYDEVTRRCAVYSHRPNACRSYPFSFVFGGRCAIEDTCAWMRAQPEIVYGTTEMQQGAVQNRAAAQKAKILTGLRDRMCRTGRTLLMIYDIRTLEWCEIKPV